MCEESSWLFRSIACQTGRYELEGIFALSHRPPGIEWADRDLDVAILTIACFYMSRDIHFFVLCDASDDEY